MKKYLLAPICSALITPGLGQIVNRHLKKGLLIMAAVFLLLIATAIQAFKLLKNMLPSPSDPSQAADLTVLHLIGIAFTVIWLYSVADALICGLRLEKKDLPTP